MEELSWYISDTHCQRAIGYLGTKLIEEGHLSADFKVFQFMEMWEEALRETTIVKEPSPIGAEAEDARKFLLASIEARISRIENRCDRMERAIMKTNTWLLRNMTHYSHRENQEIERTLYGTETTPETRPDTAP